ncbi:MAG: response regulator transcription factor [Bacteroidetes bacterium]|nr:response regulator transcription factor [Bacteroidota bacterium]
MDNSQTKIILLEEGDSLYQMISRHLVAEEISLLQSKKIASAVTFIMENKSIGVVVVSNINNNNKGFEWCIQLKKVNVSIPILLVGNTLEEDVQMEAYAAGADDYTNVPVNELLLVYKIKSLLNRHVYNNNLPSSDEKNLIQIDKERFVAIQNGKEVFLPKKEFALLSLLLSKPGKVFYRETILDVVWGGEIFVGDRTIDVHIRKLRKRLGDNCITTIKGIGYKLNTGSAK